ncbi:hypothetical protein Pcinc_011133 [Petrolisthes cinctipes]|uniref:ATP-dependent DNA helicase n=1 Tax=Petrolisthes cinctipes TaxID=88211 RepID=A0AAE1G1G9_PETCI|nr:hypothetical protein Pcinc_011133 [Petrolisthes cinctipes]
MSHKRAFEALDRTLKFLHNNDKLMGGVTVVLSGDFRQTLPVITRGTRADEVNACIKASQLWQQTNRLSLSTNIRVQLHGGESAGQFANQLLQVGNGQILPSSDDQIKLPFGQMIETENDLIMKVFPNFAQHFTSTAWLCERAILAPKNEAVNNINQKLLDAQPGRRRTMASKLKKMLRGY